MDVLGGLLLLLSMAGAVFGLVNIAKPLGWLKISKRIHGAAVVGGSVVVFVIAGVIIGMTAPTPIENAGTPEEKETLAGMTQAEFDVVWTRIKTAMEPCDAQVGVAGQALSRGDAYGAFPLVSRARETCMSASSTISAVQIPRSARGDARKALSDARDSCSMAMFLKRQAMGAVLKVVDGDSRPSAVSNARSEMQDASRQTIACVLAMTAAADAAGLVLPEFEAVVAEAEKKAG